jgi:hypothetical protein
LKTAHPKPVVLRAVDFGIVSHGDMFHSFTHTSTTNQKVIAEVEKESINIIKITKLRNHMKK